MGQDSQKKASREWKTHPGLVMGCVGLMLVIFFYAHNNSKDIQAMVGSVTTSSSGTISSTASGTGHQVWSPLGIPQGKAEALPSIRTEEKVKERTVHGTIYGGEGDKAHLGGFTSYDGQGVSPAAWKWMLQTLGVKTLMDIGCGKGVSTLWFHLHGAKVLCLEGSHDAVSHTLLPDPANQVVEHDFSRGPYWPEDTYDAVWSVEFLEHVGRNYQYNYIQSWRKAAYIFASQSRWGGWHHVEVHDADWWISRIESFGFKHSPYLTAQIRKVATDENNKGKQNPTDPLNQGPDGNSYDAQHVWLTMQVFINPMVASLPQHAHLMAEQGCFEARGADGITIKRECGSGKHDGIESTLPPMYHPLVPTFDQDEEWKNTMIAHIPKTEA